MIASAEVRNKTRMDVFLAFFKGATCLFLVLTLGVIAPARMIRVALRDWKVDGLLATVLSVAFWMIVCYGMIATVVWTFYF